jgi:hypothetical protein
VDSSAAAPAPRRRSAIDRVFAALPLAGLVLLVLTFYGYEAWLRKTPWLFSDELEWSQLSRAIAKTGHAARREQPISYKSLYAYVIAPMWWIHSTHTAYTAIKFLNALLMTAAAIPTYLLGRMLVSKRAAAVVAVLAIAIPGMSYATSIIPEPLAYTWFALCAWLSVRALTTRRIRDVVIAVVVVLVAAKVRDELSVVVPVLAVAAAGLWVTGPRGRRLRRNWSRGDTLGAIVLLVGVFELVNRFVLSHSHEWQFTTEFYKGRMVDLGLQAGLAFSIGLGLLPVICGIASLHLPDRRGEPAYRAFAAFTGSAIVFFALYAATKAAYLSTNFSTLVEERNLIYLSPLMLVGTALVFEAKRIDWWLTGAATALVVYLALAKPIITGTPYFEAPGLAILTAARDHFQWGHHDLRIALLVTVAIGLALLAARRIPGVAAVVAVLLFAWLVAGEVTETSANDSLAKAFRADLPAHADWIDRITHGQGVTYLTENVKDANGLWMTEFWNRSIEHVDSLDATAPGPGPTAGPSLVSPDGLLSYYTGNKYALADNGIQLQGKPVACWGSQVLYRLNGPWRLLQAQQYVYPDSWTQENSTWTYYARQGPGHVLVDLRRTGYKGNAPPGQVTVTAGTVALDKYGDALLGKVLAVRHDVLHNGQELLIRIPVKRTPVRIQLHISPTFQPSPADTRQVGGQVIFSYFPNKSSAAPTGLETCPTEPAS